MKKYRYSNLFLFLFVFFGCQKKTIERYDDGQLKAEGYEKKGVRVGEWIFYTSSGDTSKIVSYGDNEEIVKEKKYKQNTLFSEHTYNKGLKDGVAKHYDKEGKVGSVSHFSKGKLHGKSISYYPSGDTQVVTNYNNDVPASFTQFYENGQVEVQSEDIRNGIVFFYDSLGSLLRRVKYENFQPADTLEDNS